MRPAHATNSSAFGNMNTAALNSLASSDENAADSEEPELPKTLTFYNGLALVVGLQIGSGIFSSPAVVASNIITPWKCVGIWLLAGLLVWTGASSYIELGIAIPKNGGTQEYLRRCYSDSFAFTYAWVAIGLIKPCSSAMISLIFAEYLFTATSSQHEVSALAVKGIAFLAVAFVTFVNCLGTPIGAGAANAFLVLKFATLVSIIGIGFAVGGSGVGSGAQASTAAGSDVWASIGVSTDALFAALFAYGGWENISYVVGEMKDPRRDIPRVLNTAMASVITLFVLLNAALLAVVPSTSIGKSNTIVLSFARRILGQSGALVYAGVISLSCLGAINANIFSAARLTQAAGKRKYLPARLNAMVMEAHAPHEQEYSALSSTTPLTKLARFKAWRARQHTPVNAMILNVLPAMLFIAVGSFRDLLAFKFAVSGVFLLRRQPREDGKAGTSERYRTHGVFPVVFCFAVLALVLRSAFLHVFMGALMVLVFGAAIALHKLAY